jgi:hypothetical protein
MANAIPPRNEAEEPVTTGRELDHHYSGLAWRRHVRPAEIVGPARSRPAFAELLEDIHSSAPGIQSQEPEVMQIGTAVHEAELDQTRRNRIRRLEGEISGRNGYDSAGLVF